MAELLVSNVEDWIVPHLDRAFDVTYIERLKHMNFGQFNPESHLIIGFESMDEFTDIGSLGDVLHLAALGERIKNIVYFSACSVYAPQKRALAELDVLQAMNIVGTRAAMIEDILFYLSHRYSLNLVILRLFNPYGPYQISPYVVPTVLEKIATSGIVNVGDSEKVRDFFYVSDLIDLLGIIIDRKPEGVNVYNVGSGSPTSISELILKAQEVTGGECDVLFDATKLREEYDYDYAVADISKIKKELGWEPKVSLEEGLALTYQWILGRSGK